MAPSGCCSAATRASDALSAEEEVSPPRLPLRAEATTLGADCLFAGSTNDAERFLPLLLMRSSLAHSSAFLEGLATAEMTDWRFALEEKADAAGLLRASTVILDERRRSIGFLRQRKKIVVVVRLGGQGDGENLLLRPLDKRGGAPSVHFLPLSS